MKTVVTKSDLKAALIAEYQENPPTMRVHSGSEQVITVEFDYNYKGDDGLENIHCSPYELDFTTKASGRNTHHCIDLNFIFERLRGSRKALAVVGTSQTMIGQFKVTISPDYHPTNWRKHVKVELIKFESDAVSKTPPEDWELF